MQKSLNATTSGVAMLNLTALQQQIVLGNAYIIPTITMTLTDQTETPLFMISNPQNATTSIYLVNLNLSVDGAVQDKVYLNPGSGSVTAGKAATAPLNLRVDSRNVSASQYYRPGTIQLSTTPINVSNVYSVSSDFLLVVDPGSTLLITLTQLYAGSITNVAFDNSWYEV